MASLFNLVYDSLQPSQRSLCVRSAHYTKIGDAGGVPLQQRCECCVPMCFLSLSCISRIE